MQPVDTAVGKQVGSVEEQSVGTTLSIRAASADATSAAGQGRGICVLGPETCLVPLASLSSYLGPYACAQEPEGKLFVTAWCVLFQGIPPLPMELLTSARASLLVFAQVQEKQGGIDYDVFPLPDFPLARSLCQKLLQINPRQRLSSAREALRHPW